MLYFISGCNNNLLIIYLAILGIIHFRFLGIIWKYWRKCFLIRFCVGCYICYILNMFLYDSISMFCNRLGNASESRLFTKWKYAYQRKSTISLLLKSWALRNDYNSARIMTRVSGRWVGGCLLAERVALSWSIINSFVTGARKRVSLDSRA